MLLDLSTWCHRLGIPVLVGSTSRQCLRPASLPAFLRCQADLKSNPLSHSLLFNVAVLKPQWLHQLFIPTQSRHAAFSWRMISLLYLPTRYVRSAFGWATIGIKCYSYVFHGSCQTGRHVHTGIHNPQDIIQCPSLQWCYTQLLWSLILSWMQLYPPKFS